MDEIFSHLNATLWFILALLCAGLELLLPGIFMIWLALAALPTALLTYLFGFDPQWQVGLFVLFTICSLLMGRQVMKRTHQKGADADEGLNQRGKRLIGETLLVSEALENGRGRVREADGSWIALGPDAPVGTKVRVVGVVGSALKVVPLQG